MRSYLAYVFFHSISRNFAPAPPPHRGPRPPVDSGEGHPDGRRPGRSRDRRRRAVAGTAAAAAPAQDGRPDALVGGGGDGGHGRVVEGVQEARPAAADRVLGRSPVEMPVGQEDIVFL